ncbi:winged helix-turn-helix domain-containing protein [Paenibacillus sp. HJGM_3]|uniref:winged helix-turn-helix domain-containing protein n=1 Tax=Paenibacillus sp. HJGM_3 TaxID=3379816 RepID=UPI003858A313
MSLNLLIAEDDRSVCEMLRLFLLQEKIEPTFVYDGHEADRLMAAQPWDLVLLDWMLPGKDGIQLCKEWRAQRNAVPIILLTARTEEQDRILGLNLGADDYVTKPFSPLELMARIHAVLRRYKAPERGLATAPDLLDDREEDGLLRYKELSVDPRSREVTAGGRKLAPLTPKEFELLHLFIRNPRQVFSREQLIEQVWGYDYLGEDRTVDVHIKRLRNKISTPDRPWIATVWGVGYKLEE